jgi:hypothetical protein
LGLTVRANLPGFSSLKEFLSYYQSTVYKSNREGFIFRILNIIEKKEIYLSPTFMSGAQARTGTSGFSPTVGL